MRQEEKERIGVGRPNKPLEGGRRTERVIDELL